MTEHTLRVLLVEDDATSCMEINDYISRLDDVTLVASTNNASTAIEYMEKFLPDAVILDLELHQGGGDGLFFLAQLQQLELSKHPYILVTTNNSSNITYESARQLGADFILAKYQENYSAQYVVEFLRIMKKVLGEKYKKTDASIERAMQNAINRAWRTSDIDDLLTYYTARIHSQKGVPTIMEFIFYYANKIQNQL